MEFKRNNYIYYIDKEGNHWPGRVVFPLKEKVKIIINNSNGDSIVKRVLPKNLELQSEYKS